LLETYSRTRNASGQARQNSAFSAYLFENRTGKVYGRDAVMQSLQEKLLLSPEPFLWARLTGGAGSGKSRLALELTDAAREQGWRAGFLSTRSPFAKWQTWKPTEPTLIVVDYALLRTFKIGDREQPTGELLDCLWAAHGLSDSEIPIRFLLVDRDRDDATWRRLARFTEELRYFSDTEVTEPAFDLQPLEEEDRHAILCDEIDRLRQISPSVRRPSDSELKDFLQRLEERLKEKARPLFLLFAAHALAEGGEQDDWSAEGLTVRVLGQELRHWDRAGIDGAHLNAVLLATLLGEVTLGEVEAGRRLAAGLPAQGNDDQLRILCSLGDGYDPFAGRATGVRPDLLGELLWIRRLAGKFQLDEEKNLNALLDEARKILALAWEMNPAAVAAFVERAAQDYLRVLRDDAALGKALKTLCDRPDGTIGTEIEALFAALQLGKASPATLWAFRVAPRLTFEYGGAKRFEDAESVLRESGNALPVARAYAIGIFNATAAPNASYSECVPLAREIGVLADKHDDDIEIVRQYAKALFNATAAPNAPYSERVSLAREIEALEARHPNDPALLEQCLRVATMLCLTAPDTTQEQEAAGTRLENAIRRVAQVPEAQPGCVAFMQQVMQHDADHWVAAYFRQILA
jgi:hypothetical protein